MNDTEYLQKKVFDRTIEMCCVLKDRLLLRDSYIAPTIPQVKFTLKGKTAGKAYVERGEINFNMVFIEHNLNEFLSDTVPHEVAHIFEWAIYGKIGHKRIWKSMMQMMGVLEPKRCHYYLKEGS